MTEDEFWETADKFRSEKVWSIKNNKWVKFDIDGKIRQYGEVHLSKKEQSKYI
jgi:hypothetical protein